METVFLTPARTLRTMRRKFIGGFICGCIVGAAALSFVQKVAAFEAEHPGVMAGVFYESLR